MTVDLCIIIVSWNVSDLLHDCLQAIASGAVVADDEMRLGRYSAETWVVDSASSDGTAEMVRRTFPWVHLVASERNLGFTRGNNLALGRCQGCYALLLNPDTQVVGDALTAMLDHMEAHPDVGVLGPQLRYADGSPQSSRRRFPTLMTAFMESTLLHQWFPHNRWARAYHMRDTSDSMVQDVDWVTGACMLVRREAISQVGTLDEGYFMYSEELDWCRRIIEAGWRVVYYPQATVIHHEGGSSAQVVPARHIHFQSSKVRYFAKYHGRLASEILRWFLLGTYAWQLGEETLKFVVGHRRALRRARIQAYGQVLRSRLRSPAPAEEERS